MMSDRLENVHDWVNGYLTRAFGNDVVWEGKVFRGAQSYLDQEALAQIEHDEKTIMTIQEKAYRESILGMAPKHLKDVTVPGMDPEAKSSRPSRGKASPNP